MTKQYIEERFLLLTGLKPHNPLKKNEETVSHTCYEGCLKCELSDLYLKGKEIEND